MSKTEDRSQNCNRAYKDAVDVIGRWCAHNIGSHDGGSDGGTRSMVLTMDNDETEVTHHNAVLDPSCTFCVRKIALTCRYKV